MPKILTFSKKERLCSEKAIKEVFDKGFVFFEYPFRISWVFVNEERDIPLKTAISIPKKKIKKAFRRNLLKRRIKEAFRKNKLELYCKMEESGLNEVKDFEIINTKIIVTLQRLIKEIYREHRT
jgi:ribonuclease P protein component